MEHDHEFVIPDLHEGLLDDATLDALFADIECAAELLGVSVKGGAKTMADESVASLAHARELLRAGTVRGVQLRYQFQGAQWWDTLLRTQNGVRLVRVRHDPSQAEETL